jgi:hypothetical protein
MPDFTSPRARRPYPLAPDLQAEPHGYRANQRLASSSGLLTNVLHRQCFAPSSIYRTNNLPSAPIKKLSEPLKQFSEFKPS